MRGHVRRRGGGWAYIVDLGTDEHGRRRQKWVGGYRTRRDAEVALSEALSNLQGGSYVPPTRMTLAEYLREWLPGARVTIRHSTWKSYRMNLEKHVIPFIGSVRLRNIRVVHLNGLYATLLESGRKDGKGLSPRSVQYVHAILRRALKDAVREGLLGQNPVELARPPKSARPQTRTWNADELRAFLASTEGKYFYPAYLLAGTKGLRRGEIAGLAWADLDLEAGRMTIRRTLISVDYEVRFSEPKTERSRRTIGLDPVTVAALRVHRTRQLEHRLQAGKLWKETDLVFTQVDGSPVHPQAITDTFERAAKAAGLPRIRFHDLRHTFATVSLQAGVPLWAVSDVLGHGNVSVTDMFYRHAIPSALDDASKAVARLILGEGRLQVHE